MNKKAKIITICIVGVILLTLIGLFIPGYMLAWGPFYNAAILDPGNRREYDLDKRIWIAGSPIAGQHIAYLGSSVTYGAGSCRLSFVEYLACMTQTTYVKEAVSGTTLVDNGKKSYISRMKNMDKSEKFDLFIVQLSTNDATKGLPLGDLSESGEYDTQTICGAIEYIIGYVKETWDCPIMFYTSAYYESENYKKMVSKLLQIKEKHGIGVIDLYSNEEFNNISKEKYKLYTRDEIHPTKAGYLEWWAPQMEKEIYDYLGV